MRTAPACQVVIGRYGRWRVAVLLLAGISSFAVSAWAHGLGWGFAPTSTVLACTALALAVGIAESRRPAIHLHWDGHLWHWGPLGADETDRCEGHVEVRMDLGNWMLLRLVPSATGLSSRTGTRYLPVQREGHEQGWHALRCAVYSPAAGRNVVDQNASTA